MRILVTGKYCPDLKDRNFELPGDSFILVSDIEQAMDVLRELDTRSLVIIFDDEPDAFYALLSRMKEFSGQVKLLLIYPDDKCFIMGDNESNSPIIYHLPVNSGEGVI